MTRDGPRCLRSFFPSFRRSILPVHPVGTVGVERRTVPHYSRVICSLERSVSLITSSRLFPSDGEGNEPEVTEMEEMHRERNRRDGMMIVVYHSNLVSSTRSASVSLVFHSGGGTKRVDNERDEGPRVDSYLIILSICSCWSL